MLEGANLCTVYILETSKVIMPLNCIHQSNNLVGLDGFEPLMFTNFEVLHLNRPSA